MKSLFDKTELGSINLKNRFFRSATWMNVCDEDGIPTERAYELYENIAKGGIGTIITGYANVMPQEKATPNMLGAYDLKLVPELKKFTDFIHSFETNIIMQIAYGGSQTSIYDGVSTIWGPSTIEHRKFGVTSTEMSKENIEELIKGYATSALVAKESGFDGVQIHAAHGYLLSQFLSPYYNQRTDEYGGDIQNRARIIYQIINAMREKVGDDYPILIKINCCDFEENGLEFEDSLEVCKELDKLGIDAIEVSGGVAKNEAGKEVFRRRIMNDTALQSYFKDYAKEIAKNVKAPVLLVGGNRDYKMIEDIINTTDIEYISMSRTIVCEQDLIKKWEENPEYKPKCVACNKCWAKTGTECIMDRKARKKAERIAQGIE